MQFVNVTPHAIHIHAADGSVREIPPSGIVARVTMSTERIGEIDGIPIRVSTPGEIVDLPEPAYGVTYLASMLVVTAARRYDVLAPNDAVRDAQGRVVGCRALAASPDARVHYLRCARCGDRPLPGSGWAGLGDVYPGETVPVPGGLGGCGDLHDWGGR